MSRCKSWIAIVALLILATTVVATALPEQAEATNLRGKLRAAKHALTKSRHRLKEAEAALAAALALDAGALSSDAAADTAGTTGTTTAAAEPDVARLEQRVRTVRKSVRRWTTRVKRLNKRYRLERKLAQWERRGEWKPIIKIAAAKYHVKADGIYRMMMRESGGGRFAGSSSAFKGLFQYYTGTWSAHWNPWRHDSIYDGSSQIYATCYAVSRGMGPSMWTTTFASQY